MEFAAFLSFETRDDDVEMIAGESPGIVSGTTDSGESSPIPPPAKPRKHSYIIRKEKRENLMREVEELQDELQKLKKDETDLLREELETSLLRDVVRMQQLSLVSVQSAVSGYVSTQETIPHEVTICLGKDLVQRREALIVAKHKKIQSSLAYIAERTRFLDPFRPFSETSRFLLDGGDYCVLRDDRTPFDASRVSVRQLCDAISAYFSNVEMCATDLLGDITTRDEINYGVDGIQQSRFESSMTCGLPFEVNTVIFHEFAERSDKVPLAYLLWILSMWTSCIRIDHSNVFAMTLQPCSPFVCIREKDSTLQLGVKKTRAL